MSASKRTETDNALDTVLKQWSVEAQLPPRFQEQVWNRIAKAEVQPAPSPLAVIWRWIELALPQPKFAYAYLAVLLAAGVAAGSVAAQMKASRLESELGARYVQSIDPNLIANVP